MDNFPTIEERVSNIENWLTSHKTVLKLDEVAIYTGLSKSHLYKLTSSGGIPCYKPNGKNIYFKKSEIDEWLLQNRKATSDEIRAAAISKVVTGKKGK